MESQIENIVIYSGTALLLILVLFFYIRNMRRNSRKVDEKIKTAIEEGLYEPVSLHPVVDPNSCIRSGACIRACPEHDILGIRNGRATVINASRCVGHGACFQACPTQAITLCIGTEKRGVDLPHVNHDFESSVKGIYIAGELGGMGLIKNAVEQGRQAVENLVKTLDPRSQAQFDLIIVGAGPAGISASLTARKHNLKFLTLEQDSLGGTVFSFPRAKIVMTSSMDLPLYGRVKLFETSKPELLELWMKVLQKNEVTIREHTKVESIVPQNQEFVVETQGGDHFLSQKVLLCIGRRGSPRKLNIPGEELPKVAYRLLEPELIKDRKVLVVGGGDSAVESALMLAGQNRVLLSYRGETFSRLKPKNNKNLQEAIAGGHFDVLLNSNLVSIDDNSVRIKVTGSDEDKLVENDLVYIFAGGELPDQFLKNAGIEITRKFGEALLKHRD